MRIAVAALMTASLLTSCTTSQASGEPELQERVLGADGTCNVEAAQSLVGQIATAELGARVLRLTGARTLRWSPPDSAMTMDYRQDRVNVFYDKDMRVERITCG